MKKVIAILLLCVLIVLLVSSTHIGALSPEDYQYNSDDLIIVEYDVETGTVSSQTLGEIRDKLDPSVLASAAPDGVAVTRGKP